MKNVNWKFVGICSGAFVAYHCGSGFASGQEVMQFFGSWGGNWVFIVPLITAVLIILFCALLFSTGMGLKLDKPSDAYEHYCGHYIAKFMDAFTILNLTATAIIMYAGSGAAIHQHLGIPEYVGASILGVISLFVIWLGLEKLTKILGAVGIIKIGFIIFGGLFIAATLGLSGLVDNNVTEYVAEGKVLQAGIAGITNPIIAGLFYAGMIILNSFPFIISMLPQVKNKETAVACGFGSSILLTVGVWFVLFMVLPNLDYIVSQNAQILTLAAINKCIPILSFPFLLILVIGMFTTITGFLWIVGRRFAPDRSTKQRAIVFVITVVGVGLGSVLPFDRLVNFLYPLTGLVGGILFLIVCFSIATHRVK